MSSSRRTPLRGITRGLLAGAVGTLAMDLLWFARYKRGDGKDNFVDWELSAGTDSYENAGAPAQIGKRMVEGLFQVDLEPDTAAFMNNAVHWGTGMGWGSFYGVTAGSLRNVTPLYGLALGPVAWVTSYVLLGAAKLYRPMWEYDVRTLGRDLGAHVLFGTATAAAFRALTARLS